MSVKVVSSFFGMPDAAGDVKMKMQRCRSATRSDRIAADRRQFLCGGALAFVAATAGTIGLLGCSSTRGVVSTTTGFRWEVSNLDGSVVDAYFRVVKNLFINGLNIDVAYAVLSPASATGCARMLCRAGLSRGAAPQFSSSGFQTLPNSNFGPLSNHNPNNLTIASDPNPSQNIFYSTILKTWVTQPPTASATSRQVRSDRGFALNVDDYLVFQISHAGVPGDGQMNVVLEYA